MIRTILVMLFVVLYLIITIPVALILKLIGIWKPHCKEVVSLRMIQWVFRVILFLSGVHLTIKGKENIPDDRPVLYVGNHSSYFDVVVGYTCVKGLCGFIAKKEMLKIPLLSMWMKHLHCLFLDRANVKEGLKTILAAVSQIKAGISIWIFPEGTRSKDGKMLPFKEGSMKIAEKTGCPIIPVALFHTADVFENHQPFIRKTDVTIRFGTPIDPKSLSKEEKKFLGTYTQSVIQKMLDET
jgi:1-acyl-sn-glycerol-3-phosphate acyltransferase